MIPVIVYALLNLIIKLKLLHKVLISQKKLYFIDKYFQIIFNLIYLVFKFQ